MPNAAATTASAETSHTMALHPMSHAEPTTRPASLMPIGVNQPGMGSGSVRQRLVHFFAGMFAAARENLPVVRLAFSIYYGPPQGAPFIDFHRFFDLTLEKIDLLIAEGMESGEIRHGDG